MTRPLYTDWRKRFVGDYKLWWNHFRTYWKTNEGK